MGNSIVKYSKYSPEAAEQDAKEASSGGSFMKLEVGKTKVRVLPPPVGKSSPFKTVNQHFIELNGEKLVFACPRYEAKKPCPACMEADRLRKTGNPADRDAAKDYYAKKRFFVNVIDRANPEKGVQILGIGFTIHGALTKLAQDVDAGGDFTDPEQGYDIIINRTGTGKNDTEYTVFPAKNSTPLAPTAEQMQDWIDNQPELDRLSTVKEASEIDSMMKGEDADSTDAKASRAKDVSASKESSGSGRVQHGGRQAPARRSAQDDIEDAEVAEDD